MSNTKDLQSLQPMEEVSDEETGPENERDIIAAVEEEVMVVSDHDDKLNDLEAKTKMILEKACQSNNPKINLMYSRWQKKWFSFVKKNKVDGIFNDLTMIAFFDELLEYQPSTLLVAYSCINSW